MGSLRQAWANIQKYLGQLSGKDKTLIGALIVVAALVMVLFGLWSSKAAMVPLLPDMGPEANASAVETLKDADIAYESRDGKVYVLPEKRMAALAYLQQAGKLPENSATLFANLIKNQNWMASKSQSDQINNAALCEVLSAIVSNFKGVEKAAVMIDAPETTGFGTSYRKPTASVGVTMKSGRTLDKELVDAIAAMISGAKAGLAIDNVRVVDLRNGRQFTASATEDYRASDYLDSVTKFEERLQKKVGEIIGRFDPLCVVSASVQVENTSRNTVTDKVLPESKTGGSVSFKVREKTTENTESSGSGAAGSAAPGLNSNVGADVASGAGVNTGSKGSQQNTTESEFKPEPGREKTTVVAPGGMPTRISVMISLSREYIAGLIKLQKSQPTSGGAAPAASAEPTQAEIEAAFAKEKTRLEKDITPLVQTVAVENQASTTPRVTVALIPVPQTGPLLATIGLPGASVSSSGDGGLVGQLLSGSVIKTAFLGLLAFVALGMMLMLVKKSSKPQDLPTAEEIVGLPPIIDAAEDVVGEADEGAMAMEGIELDEGALKNKKMLESIEEMVKKNPQDAASMLTRWLNVEH